MDAQLFITFVHNKVHLTQFRGSFDPPKEQFWYLYAELWQDCTVDDSIHSKKPQKPLSKCHHRYVLITKLASKLCTTNSLLKDPQCFGSQASHPQLNKNHDLQCKILPRQD